MHNIFKPIYKHSIINIPASISSYAGVRNKYPKSAVLQKELRKKYKNIVFILFDGLGKSIVNKHLKPSDIMRANIKETLHSVFPPTTTAATTTYLTCSYPSEHGWLGWNMYFEKPNKVIDLFSNRETFSQVYVDDFDIKSEIGAKTIFDKIDKAGKYKVTTLYPESIRGVYSRNVAYKSTKDMFCKIKRIVTNSQDNFLYCYNESPDNLMHEFGTNSVEAKEFVVQINKYVEDLTQVLEDCLVIICADHGQIDVKNRIFLHEYEDLCAMLDTPPYIDSRAVSFRVKDHMRVQFYNLFMKYFGNEFVLLTKQTIQKKKLFGGKSELVDRYIGDFVAIGVGNSIIQYTNRKNDMELFNFKGHHAGLTREEVEVPLILIGKK